MGVDDVFRFAFLAVLAVLVAGCISPHPLSTNDVRALRLEAIELNVADSASIEWKAALEDYMAANGHPPDPAQLRAFAAQKMSAKFRALAEPELRGILAGNRPVRLKITVSGLRVPTFAQDAAVGILLGPSASQSTLGVAAEIVDVRTGRYIIGFPAQLVQVQGGTKLDIGLSGYFSGDPVERLLANFENQLTAWLLKNG